MAAAAIAAVAVVGVVFGGCFVIVAGVVVVAMALGIFFAICNLRCNDRSQRIT